MAQAVIIKSNRYGINLVLDNQMPFQELLECIGEKFRETENFFKDAKMAISFRNRKLTEEEEMQVIDKILENSSIRIVSIFEENTELEEKMKALLENTESSDRIEVEKNVTITDELASSEPTEIVADFYKGNLRSGQVLQSTASITFVGDVNPGAKIISSGNIVILGSLKGNAWAGAEGEKNCFIYAVDMNPLQLQIGDIIAKSPDNDQTDKRGRKKNKNAKKNTVPQVAVAKDDNIQLEIATRSIFNQFLG